MKTKHKQWFALTASTLGLSGLSFASGFGDEKYTYDASGNVLEKQIGDQVTRYDYTGNQLNGSASDSGRKQYAYDSSGRLTTDSEAGKPTRNMEHQYLDKVTKVKNGDKTTELFYNAEGQLVATNSAGTSEAFAWDGLAMVNRGEKLYVNEAHAVGGVPAIVGNDVAVSDMIGTSLSIGLKSLESTAYGEGSSDGLFTGRPFIKDLDGFLFKFRTYSAEEARWKTADPSGFPDGHNSFAYALSDPLKNVDPFGLWIKELPEPGGPNPKGSATPSLRWGDRRSFSSSTFAKQWTFDEWHETNHEAHGTTNETVKGSHRATESNVKKIEIGVELTLLEDLKIRGSKSDDEGESLSITHEYIREGVPDNAWLVRLGQAKGTIREYEQKFKSMGGGRNRKFVPNGMPSVTTTIQKGIIIPTSLANIWYSEN